MAVDGGDYRFFSTEYDPADLEKLQNRQVRPLRLDGLTLTNDPNNKGGKPITNRNEFRQPADADTADKQKPQQNKKMKSVCTLLGLSADASEDAVLAEVTKIKNRLTTVETELTPVKNRVITLETENANLLTEQIDADFATAGIADEKIINRHKPLLADAKHFKNRAERLAFIADLAPQETESPATTQTAQRKLTNRETRPPGNGTPATEGNEQVRAQKITNRARELHVNGRSWDSAWQQAQSEVTTAKN